MGVWFDMGLEAKKIIILHNNHILMLIVTFPEVNDKSRISLTRLYNLTRRQSWKEKNIGFCHNSIKYTQFEWLMNGTLLLSCLNFSSMVRLNFWTCVHMHIWLESPVSRFKWLPAIVQEGEMEMLLTISNKSTSLLTAELATWECGIELRKSCKVKNK